MLIKACATLQRDVNSLQSNFVFPHQRRGHLGLNFAKETSLQFKASIQSVALRSITLFPVSRRVWCSPSSGDADGALSTRLRWGELMKKYNAMAGGQQCLWAVSSWPTAFPLYDSYTSNRNRHLPRSNNSPAEECRIVLSERCPWCQRT